MVQYHFTGSLTELIFFLFGDVCQINFHQKSPIEQHRNLHLQEQVSAVTPDAPPLFLSPDSNQTLEASGDQNSVDSQ